MSLKSHHERKGKNCTKEGRTYMNNNPIDTDMHIENDMLIDAAIHHEHQGKSMSERMDDTERSFALRHFSKALHQSNQILNDHDYASSTPPTSNSQQTMIYKLKLSNLQSALLVDDHDYKGTKQKPDGNMFTVNLFMNVKQKQKQKQTQESSIIERASAVAIQSSYELWKTRKSDNNTIDKELCLNLLPFFHLFNRSQNKDFEKQECEYERESACKSEENLDMPIISLELAALYIHFCHAVGLIQSTIISCLQILSALSDLERKILIDSGNGNDNDDYEMDMYEAYLYNNSVEFLNLLLVQTLPRLEDARVVRSVTDAICTLVRSRDDGNPMLIQMLDETNSIWNDARMSSTNQSSSVEAIRRNMEAIVASEEGSISPGVLCEAIQSVLLDANDIFAQILVKPDADRFDMHTSISSAIGETAHRLEYAGDDATDEKDGQSSTEKLSLLDEATEYLWESDDRWLNRGKVVVFGILTYSAWQRRRHIYKRTKGIGAALLSPIREIVDAITETK